MTKSKWFLPAFSVALGGIVLAAQWAGGDPSGGLISFAILAAAGAIFLVGGRWSETIRGLRGDGRDERFMEMDVHATALSGMAIITAIIVAFIVELAQGEDGMPYAWLGAIGGVTYLVAIVALRLRK